MLLFRREIPNASLQLQSHRIQTRAPKTFICRGNSGRRRSHRVSAVAKLSTKKIHDFFTESQIRENSRTTIKHFFLHAGIHESFAPRERKSAMAHERNPCRTATASRIFRRVIYDSEPFDEGTPDWRGSIATASRSARAVDLNSDSEMWWLFEPWCNTRCRFIRALAASD